VVGWFVRMRGLAQRQRGQGMVEYALILVLVAIVVIAVLTLMGQQIKNVFQDVVQTLQGTPST
jgi:pilus assembly protein Flp/PilA